MNTTFPNRVRSLLLLLAGVMPVIFSVQGQPRITGHPASRMVLLGAPSTTLRVVASGAAPLAYQWFFDEFSLPSATNAALTLTNIQRAQAGLYSVLVSDPSGSITSRVARIDVFTRIGIFDIGDPVEFEKILSTNTPVKRLATRDSWIEGVVWVPTDGGFVLFSDIPANRLVKFVPPSTLTNFLTPPPNTKINGNLLDLNERLISCQSGSAGLKVVITTNGVSVPLASEFTGGLKFYSPNDLAIKSDGSIWFTDPGYDSGLPLPPPIGTSVPRGFQPGLFVYRFFQTNGNATIAQVITNMSRPNGICFSADEKRLYVADSNAEPGPIRVFDVTSSNTVTGGSILCTVGAGVPDGIKCDIDGRIWSSAGDGVQVFAPDGRLIVRIRMTRTANLCFGGPDYKTLYIVGQPYLSSIDLKVPGAVAMKRLATSVNGGRVNLEWPAPSTGFKLQTAPSVNEPSVWSDHGDPAATTETVHRVQLEATGSAKFFRLKLN